MRDNGKGDKRRPLVIPEEQFNANWDAIFKKKSFEEEFSKRISNGEFDDAINEGIEEGLLSVFDTIKKINKAKIDSRN